MRAVAPLLLAVLFAVCWKAECVRLLSKVQDDQEKFIGWAGETYEPPRINHKEGGQSEPWFEVVAWQPRAVVAHGFISRDEARHIRMLAARTLRRSRVLTNGTSVIANVARNSYGTFLTRLSDPVLAAIDERIADWVHIPPIHGEDMQVLRYDTNQFYKIHFDGLLDNAAGPRVATVLLYLSDMDEGGETAFPSGSQWVHPELQERMGPFSDCTKGGVAFKPKLGDALLFWSIQPDGKSQDKASLHTGCPVIRGVKWTATKWVHARPYNAEQYRGKVLAQDAAPPPHDPGHCEDSHRDCRMWKDQGECHKNRGYMLGGDGQLGACRLSCGVCTPCRSGDLGCYNKNRKELGYLQLQDVSPASDWLF